MSEPPLRMALHSSKARGTAEWEIFSSTHLRISKAASVTEHGPWLSIPENTTVSLWFITAWRGSCRQSRAQRSDAWDLRDHSGSNCREPAGSSDVARPFTLEVYGGRQRTSIRPGDNRTEMAGALGRGPRNVCG